MKAPRPDHDAILLPNARYEGGNSMLGDVARDGALRISAVAIAMYPFTEGNTLPLSQIESLEIKDLPPAPKSRVPWVALFGVLGLGAKGSTSQASITVRTRGGDSAYFTVKRTTSIQLRGQLAAVLRGANVRLLD